MLSPYLYTVIPPSPTATMYGAEWTNCTTLLLPHWSGGRSDTPPAVTNMPRPPGALRRNSSYE